MWVKVEWLFVGSLAAMLCQVVQVRYSISDRQMNR